MLKKLNFFKVIFIIYSLSTVINGSIFLITSSQSINILDYNFWLQKNENNENSSYPLNFINALKLTNNKYLINDYFLFEYFINIKLFNLDDINTINNLLREKNEKSVSFERRD